MASKRKTKEQQFAEMHLHNALISVARDLEHAVANIDGTGTAERVSLVAARVREIAAGKVTL